MVVIRFFLLLSMMQELGLVPASVLNFSWSPDIEEGRTGIW